MQTGPACYEIAPAQQISVSGHWNPYQSDLIVAREQEVFAGNPEDVIKSETGQTTSGKRLFTMPPLDDAAWIELDIRPIGTRFLTGLHPDAYTAPEISSGFKWTPARARITWAEGGGQLRSIDCDIGAGTNFALPPSTQCWVDLLVANPATFSDVAIPPDSLPRSIVESIIYNTTVSCKATCVQSPGINRSCLTRLFYLGRDGFPDPARSSAQASVLVPKGTVEAYVFVGQTGTAGPSSDPQITPSELVLRWESRLLEQPLPVTHEFLSDILFDALPSARFALEGAPTDISWRTGRVTYPGALYNALRAKINNTENRVLLTVKFCLDI